CGVSCCTPCTPFYMACKKDQNWLLPCATGQLTPTVLLLADEKTKFSKEQLCCSVLEDGCCSSCKMCWYINNRID
ncbi:MAG: hypothetical protein MHPSP_000831, partial [Paramarteilia canceri]